MGPYWPGRSAAGLYRPVTTFSYLLNYAVLGNGENPEGYHVINFILHGINASLVYALALLIFEVPAPALALAAIWAVHPVLTESVTNIIGRADLLAGLGLLAGLLCYLKGQAAQSGRFAWVLGLAAAQALGLFSKESAAVLVGLMLLSDVTGLARSRLAVRLPFYAASVLVCAVFLVVRMGPQTHMEVPFIENPLVGAGFWTARLTAIKILCRYLWLFLWPSRLSADYSFNSIPVFSWRLTDPGDAGTVLAALLFAAGIGYMLRRAARSPSCSSSCFSFSSLCYPLQISFSQ